MNILTPKIEFYRLRNFTDKLNATFQFIRENWKPLIKFTFYMLLPICLIQTLVMNSIVSTAFRMGANDAYFNTFNSANFFFINYGLFIFCAMIGSILLAALVYALMQTYEQREYRLVNTQWSDFKEFIIKNAKRCIALIVFGIVTFLLLAIALGVVGSVLFSTTSSIVFTIFMIFVFLFLIMIICIPLSLVMPIYIFDTKISLGDTVAKAWKWGFNHFWSLLGFLIVISIISYVLQTVTMAPWYITLLVGNILSLNSDPSLTQSVFYKFAIYILGLIQSMGNYISMIILLIGLAFQYFHLREKFEGVTIESNITNFNELQ